MNLLLKNRINKPQNKGQTDSNNGGNRENLSYGFLFSKVSFNGTQ